ncbi:Kelch repeat-containing protein [Cupriavidus basilensis]
MLTPELWDPATEKFQKLAAMATPRTYHSVALLLRDGRVLSGGGGLCGGCTTNHPNVEILTPPYLLNADGSAA